MEYRRIVFCYGAVGGIGRVIMTNHSIVISASEIDATIAAINAAAGTLIQVLAHPYQTDGVGPMLIVLWSTP